MINSNAQRLLIPWNGQDIGTQYTHIKQDTTLTFPNLKAITQICTDTVISKPSSKIVYVSVAFTTHTLSALLWHTLEFDSPFWYFTERSMCFTGYSTPQS